MVKEGSVIFWLSILLSGLVSAFLAAVFTHWVETYREKQAKRKRLLNHLCLAEIDLSINGEREPQDNTDYLVDGIRALLQSHNLETVQQELVINLVKMLRVMELFNQANEPFQKPSAETTRINMLHKKCVDSANKLLGVKAPCKNELPKVLNPKINEVLNIVKQVRVDNLGIFKRLSLKNWRN